MREVTRKLVLGAGVPPPPVPPLPDPPLSVSRAAELMLPGADGVTVAPPPLQAGTSASRAMGIANFRTSKLNGIRNSFVGLCKLTPGRSSRRVEQLVTAISEGIVKRCDLEHREARSDEAGPRDCDAGLVSRFQRKKNRSVRG